VHLAAGRLGGGQREGLTLKKGYLGSALMAAKKGNFLKAAGKGEHDGTVDGRKILIGSEVP